MKRYVTKTAIIGVGALLLAACGSPPADTGGGGGGGANQGDVDVERAQNVDQQVLEAAKKEGSITYWSTIIQQETHQRLAEGFRQRYGLSDDFGVNYTLLSSSDLTTRADEEISTGNVTADVLSSGSIHYFYDLKEAGELMKYNSPAYEHYDPAFKAGMGERGYWAADGFSLDTPIWNSEYLPDVKIESWQDVLDYDLQGKIMMGDVEGSSTRRLSYLAMRKILPRSYFEKLAKFNPGFAVRSEEVAQATVTGEFPFAFGGMPTRGYQMEQQAGGDVSLEVAYPKEGIVLLPQVFTILQQAPHPNAAKLWIDYIFSEEGQRIYQEGEALFSGREGFQTPSEKWAPPIDQINVVPMEWDEVTPKQLNQIEAEWTQIFRN